MKAVIKAFIGTAVCAVVIVSFLVLLVLKQGQYYSTAVPFEVVDPGNGYGYETRANFTITNATKWESLWLQLYSGHFPAPEVPVVNFTSEILIAVFQGEQSSGGYSTNITAIRLTDSLCVVYVDEIHPGEGCGVTAVMTYPYQIVKITHHIVGFPIWFVYNIIVNDCG